MIRTKRKPGTKRPRPLPEIVPTGVYSQRQCSALLGIDDARVAEERAAGRLPGRRDGKRFIHSGQAVLDWIAGRFPRAKGRKRKEARKR